MSETEGFTKSPISFKFFNMKEVHPSLMNFHPLLQLWFANRYGDPTDVQVRVWPEIMKGKHLLITAPTGSGKTLSAFLWGLNQLITQTWPPGGLRILYISPLKALNNDIRLNLLEPLSELRVLFKNEGETFPSVYVQTRSGDTPSSERQRMIRRPPEILITTPESLNLLLSSVRARSLLRGITTVILDEIHAVAPNKRGTHLMTAVERLVLLSGEFQRIALSATIRPAAMVADFVGGYEIETTDGGYNYRRRKVSLIQSMGTKNYDVKVCTPDSNRHRDFFGHEAPWLDNLVSELRMIINGNRSTLLFTNSRRLTEKLTRLINENRDGDIQLAYSHHGSLSKELRRLVEKKLKMGELRAIVATSSLELGIDIGRLDEVVLVQAPFSISSALQRAGRAGHSVGEISRARIYPLYPRDILASAVISQSLMNQDIEEANIPLCPLDVLAQIILSMTGLEPWDIDELYAFLKTSFSYRNLTRKQFDLILEMLAGRYEETRIRELRPRILIDPINNTVRGKEGVLRLVYLAGGTIPDRGYFQLIIQGTGEKVGELDEEFVWERSVGDVFVFGTQTWKIQRIGHQNVEVVWAGEGPSMAPFWRAEFSGRDFFLSDKIARCLERFNKVVDRFEAEQRLKEEFCMDDQSARALIGFLEKQKKATAVDLPHRHNILIECVSGASSKSEGLQVILHTLWGGKINLPFSIALKQAWEEKYGGVPRVYQDDDCILLDIPPGDEVIRAEDILLLVTSDTVELFLRKSLEKTGFFSARFRENAARALLLPRKSFNRRMPLWLSRLRSKKLLSSVLKYDDFPVLAETWRTCLHDEFDMANLRMLLDEIERGEIGWTMISSAVPSTFALDIVRQHTLAHIYGDDTPEEPGISELHDILKDLVFSSELRPRLPHEVIRGFTEKLQRLLRDYTPGSSDDLLAWVCERTAIPRAEWEELIRAVARDHHTDVSSFLTALSDRIVAVRLPRASCQLVTAYETLIRILKALFYTVGSEEDYAEDPMCNIIAEWLRYYGPVKQKFIEGLFGIDNIRMEKILESLLIRRIIVIDRIVEDTEEPEICDAENLEILLRIRRKAARPSFRALELGSLPLFLAAHQGLTAGPPVCTDINTEDSLNALQDCMGTLIGYPAHAGAWESELFPARLSPYFTAWLDRLTQQSELTWFGCGPQRISFCFEGDRELFLQPRCSSDEDTSRIFPDTMGKYSFWDLHRYSGLNTEELAEKLWELTWKGTVINDSFSVLRKALENGFRVSEPQQSRGRRKGLRTHFNRWQATRPLPGNWYVADCRVEEYDFIEQEEITRERVRQLLLRYGILFRELLVHELPELQWQRIFRSLRIMELSGEILAGYFFQGIPGLQFISHSAYQELRQKLPEESIYWMNAVDPASLCGIRLEHLDIELPRRVPTTHIVFHGKKPVLISKKRGAVLEFEVPADSPHIQDYLGFFRTLLNREFLPLAVIKVHTINGESVLISPYMEKLLEFGFRKSHRELILRRDYR